MRAITIEQLTEFVEWYFRHFGCEETCKACFINSMEGYLHIGARQSKACFSICKKEMLISCRKDVVVKGGGCLNDY